MGHWKLFIAAAIGAAGVGLMALALSVLRPSSRSSPADAAPLIRADDASSVRDAGSDDAVVRGADARTDRRAVAHVKGRCEATIDDDDPHLFDEAIAMAVLDGYDADRNEVSIADVDGGTSGEGFATRFTVTDCRGQKLRAYAMDQHPPGTVLVSANVLADASMAGEVAARVAIGGEPGLCSNETGFIALLALRNKRVEVDALGHFNSGCAGIYSALKTMRLGADQVLLADNGGGGEDGVSDSRNDVYLRRGRELTFVGSMASSIEPWHLQNPDGKPELRRSMTATFASTARGIDATETWTFVPVDGEFNPVPGGKTQTSIVVRHYWLEGDTLKRSPEKDPTTPR